MKAAFTHTLTLTALLLNLPLQAAEATPGLVTFGQFTKPTNGELVEINLNGDTIAMALQLAGQGQPDFADALAGLQAVRVSVIGLDDQNRENVINRMRAVRGELESGGWQRIVSVQDKKEDVGIYLKSKGREAIQGVVVTVTDGRKEAVFVNVAGELKMEKLMALGEKLNIGAIKKAAEAIMKQANGQPNDQAKAPKE